MLILPSLELIVHKEEEETKLRSMRIVKRECVSDPEVTVNTFMHEGKEEENLLKHIFNDRNDT